MLGKNSGLGMRLLHGTFQHNIKYIKLSHMGPNFVPKLKFLIFDIIPTLRMDIRCSGHSNEFKCMSVVPDEAQKTETAVMQY